jgi:hypothetical protein
MNPLSFIHSSMALQPFVGPWPLLQFRNPFYTDGRTPWTSDQPVARPLPTHRTTQTPNRSTHKHPCLSVGLEPTIPAFERAKTVHALDRAATLIGKGKRPWRPIRLWDVEAPAFSSKSAHRWRWGCQPYAPAALYPQEYSWYSFLLEAESTPGP